MHCAVSYKLCLLSDFCYVFVTQSLHKHLEKIRNSRLCLINNTATQPPSIPITKKTVLQRNLTKLMSDQSSSSLSTLPVELVYRILDHFQPCNVLVSIHCVCAKWNSIVDTDQPFQVTLIRPFSTSALSFWHMPRHKQCTCTNQILVDLYRSNSLEYSSSLIDMEMTLAKEFSVAMTLDRLTSDQRNTVIC